MIADLVEDGVRRCVSDADLEMKDISGLCIGLPGVVERSAGVCRQSPIFSDRDVAFGPQLTERLGVPVTIDCDVNLCALAEHWFGQGRGTERFSRRQRRTQPWSGILHNGELFRGANGLSPDLGDFMVRSPATRAAVSAISRLRLPSSWRWKRRLAAMRSTAPRRTVERSLRCCSALTPATRVASGRSWRRARPSASPSPTSSRCLRRRK